MLINKTKCILTVIAVGLSGFLNAQTYLRGVVVGAGGIYEFTTPTDYASVGVISGCNLDYDVKHSVMRESTQHAVIDADTAYFAFEDSIVKYNLRDNQVIYQFLHSSLKSLSLLDTLLGVGNFYGTDDFFSLYNKNTGLLVKSFPEIDNRVDGAVLLNDSIYVPFNESGKLGFFPPDTIGKIAVIDLNTLSVARIIDLDTAGAGLRQIFTDGNLIYTLASENGNVISISPTSGVVFKKKVGAEKGFAFHQDSLVFLSKTKKLSVYDFSADMLTQSATTHDIMDLRYDTLNQEYYGGISDYFSYGRVLKFNSALELTDSVTTDVSPEGIALWYSSEELAPFAADDYYTIPTGNMQNTFQVLDNDCDPNGDVITATLSVSGLKGLTTLPDGVNIFYTPNVGASGMDTIYYNLCDNNGTPMCVNNIMVVVNISDGTSLSSVEMTKENYFFPNPSNGIITFQNGDRISDLQVFDLAGKEVKRVNKLTSNQVDLSDLSEGWYVIEWNESGTNYHQKLGITK